MVCSLDCAHSPSLRELDMHVAYVDSQRTASGMQDFRGFVSRNFDHWPHAGEQTEMASLGEEQWWFASGGDKLSSAIAMWPGSGGWHGAGRLARHEPRRANKKTSNPMSEPEYIDPKQLRPGPIRHKTLPPELLEQVKAIFDVIGPYIGMPLEQFEIGFMRDMHPESE